jgi:hypothetical protein
MDSGEDPSEAELEDLVREVDHDGNGNIDLLEFCRTMTAKLRPTRASEQLHLTKPHIRQPTGGGRRAKEDYDATGNANPTTKVDGHFDAKGNRIRIKQPTAKRAKAKPREVEHAPQAADEN